MDRGQEVTVFLLLVLNLIWGVASVALQIRVLRELRDTKKSTVEPPRSTVDQEKVIREDPWTYRPQRIERSPLLGSEARRERYNR